MDMAERPSDPAEFLGGCLKIHPLGPSAFCCAAPLPNREESIEPKVIGLSGGQGLRAADRSRVLSCRAGVGDDWARLSLGGRAVISLRFRCVRLSKCLGVT